jgi:hypothetical protein
VCREKPKPENLTSNHKTNTLRSCLTSIVLDGTDREGREEDGNQIQVVQTEKLRFGQWSAAFFPHPHVPQESAVQVYGQEGKTHQETRQADFRHQGNRRREERKRAQSLLEEAPELLPHPGQVGSVLGVNRY